MIKPQFYQCHIDKANILGSIDNDGYDTISLSQEVQLIITHLIKMESVLSSFSQEP